MNVDRRTLLVGSLAMAAASSLPGKRRAAPADWYDRSIIIDALGGTGDPYAPDGQTRISDRAWSETVATGVTIVRDTVFPVG
ncbi:MAG: hypothetical protein ACJ8EP_06110, partial [Sphingomicrobium sp.]